MSQPSNPKPKLPPDFSVEPLEPSLFTEPDFQSWYQPESLPTILPRIHASQSVISPEISIITPPELSWFQPAGEPTRRLPPIAKTLFVTSPEVSLFTDPPILSWFAPISEPTIPKPRLPSTVFVSPLEPSLAVDPPPLSWNPAVSQPKIVVRQPFHTAFFADFSQAMAAPVSIEWVTQAPLPNRRPRLAGGGTVEPLSPNLRQEPPPLSWEPHVSQPTYAKKPTRPGLLVGTLEPTLYITPPYMDWMPINDDGIKRRKRPAAQSQSIEPLLQFTSPIAILYVSQLDQLSGDLTMFEFAPGATSVTIYFKLRDATTAQGKTGLVFNSAGARASYVRDVLTSVSIPLVALAAADSAWAAGGFHEVDATKQPGLYRLDLPDDVCLTGVNFAIASMGFTGVLDQDALILLRTPDNTAGAGSIAWTITVTDNVATPLDGAEVWVSTDIAGANVVAGTLHTNSFGLVTFMLDAGTYYLWVQHSGYNATNPTAFTVS